MRRWLLLGLGHACYAPAYLAFVFMALAGIFIGWGDALIERASSENAGG